MRPTADPRQRPRNSVCPGLAFWEHEVCLIGLGAGTVCLRRPCPRLVAEAGALWERLGCMSRTIECFNRTGQWADAVRLLKAEGSPEAVREARPPAAVHPPTLIVFYGVYLRTAQTRFIQMDRFIRMDHLCLGAWHQG